VHVYRGLGGGGGALELDLQVVEVHQLPLDRGGALRHFEAGHEAGGGPFAVADRGYVVLRAQGTQQRIVAGEQRTHDLSLEFFEGHAMRCSSSTACGFFS
jgi:hypothetical protein